MSKNILVGVCGSIAAYKAPEVVRLLRKKGWQVKVVMTAEATRFITPLTLEVVSGETVYLNMFDRRNREITHIALNEFASLILVVGATANIIGKVASGLCDDLLTCTICAARSQVIFAPAMNENMWLNPAVQKNVRFLKKNGYLFVGPEKGELASGKVGWGRMAEPATIVTFVERSARNG
ncbi:MAG TPA: flavoprotein [bacterium]|nr:flavoprotein [bacterium]